MTAPTREQVEALLALEAKVNRPGGARHVVEANDFYDAARNLIRPLAEAYLATLDARREGEREALRGMERWVIGFERITLDPKAMVGAGSATTRRSPLN